MTIVCDRHIPYLVEAVQAHWPEVQICPMEADEITASSVREADVLVIRTRTIVNESLLSGSHVRLVCTATIGFDHIDTAYCAANGIRWMSCPGCNAQAVCDYIEEALEEYPITNTPTIGIVGVGHVGSLVASMAARKGYTVLLNDPPKRIGVSLDEIARECDIITFHVPLTGTPNTARCVDRIKTEFPTFHLCDEVFLAKCKPHALIINAARGGVVDEPVLLESGHPYVLDTWESEPDIRSEVVNHALLASMHIAGYSAEGKRNATQMCLDAIADEFHLAGILVPHPKGEGDREPGWLKRISDRLKSAPMLFETLRKNYVLR